MSRAIRTQNSNSPASPGQAAPRSPGWWFVFNPVRRMLLLSGSAWSPGTPRWCVTVPCALAACSDDHSIVKQTLTRASSPSLRRPRAAASPSLTLWTWLQKVLAGARVDIFILPFLVMYQLGKHLSLTMTLVFYRW